MRTPIAIPKAAVSVGPAHARRIADGTPQSLPTGRERTRTVDEREAVEYLRGRGWICLTAEEAKKVRAALDLSDLRSRADTQWYVAAVALLTYFDDSGGGAEPSPHKHGEGDLFDPMPGDGYPDGPVNSQGEPLDIGPPLPGEWNEDEYPNPEIGMKC